MASFDMINAVGHAYRKTWDERAYLARMALIVFVVKSVSYILATSLVGTDNVLRFSLCMIPSYFVEGWLLAHWVRTIVLDHRWPFQPSGDDKADELQLSERGRGVLGGMVAFVLINLVMAGYFAFFVAYIPMDMDPQEVDSSVAALGALLIVSTILLFRFVWFYIPLAVNMTPLSFVKRVMPMGITFNLMGVWLVCIVPPVTVLYIAGGLIYTLGGGEDGGSALMEGMMAVLHVAFDMLKNLLCTAGVTYAFIELFKWKSI